MGALSDQDQSDLNQVSAAEYVQGRDADSGGAGALSTVSSTDSGTDDQGNDGSVVSPQDQRTLQHLDWVRGQMAPKHTGATLLEGYGQAADNEYKTMMATISANAKARAAMNQQTLRNQGLRDVASMRGDTSVDVANINAGKNAQRVLTEGEARQMGLDVPPGWSGTINAFGKVTTVSRPNASQVQAVGEDGNGTVYARPGQVLTPAQRSQNEKYLNAAGSVSPYLDESDPTSLFSKLQDPNATTALGGPGMMERASQSVMGLVGSNKNVSPSDTDLRAEGNAFNRQAVQLYKTVPGNENMSPKQLEAFEKDNLPDWDNSLESRANAFAKMAAFKKMYANRVGQAQHAMAGQGNFQGGGSPATPNAPAMPTPEQATAELARRKAARGGQ